MTSASPLARDAPTARAPPRAARDEQHDGPARPHRTHEPLRRGRRPPGDPGLGRGALQPRAPRRVGGAPAPHALGGITVVATLRVLEPPRARARRSPDFGGGLDVAAFVSLCGGSGWTSCCASVRGATARSATAASPTGCRTPRCSTAPTTRPTSRSSTSGSPQLGAELAPRCGPRRRVIAIQLENELYDQPGHLADAEAAGKQARATAPLWTATAWGGAELPAGEVLPLYGGYGDGFWVDADRRGTPRSASTSSSPTPGTTRASAPTCASTPAIGRHGDGRARPRPTSPPRRASSAAAWPPPTIADRSSTRATSPPWPTARSATARAGRATTCTPAA